MMLLIALLPVALSYSYPLCVGPQVTGTIPEARASSVPIDLVPQLVITDGGCRLDMELDITLSTLNGAEELIVHQELAEVRARAPEPVLPLSLQDELEPQTFYVLRVGEGNYLHIEVSFWTGDGRLDEVVGQPTLLDATLTHNRSLDGKSHSIYALVHPASPDPWGAVLLRDAEAPGEAVTAAPVDGQDQLGLWQYFADGMGRDSICVEAVQLDGHAEEVGVSEAICVESERAGCSSAGGRAGGGLGLAGLALLAGLIGWRRSTRSSEL